MDVSVIIRAKNEALWLGTVLRSVRAQSGGHQVEIILVDSGSTDQTVNIGMCYGCRVIHIRPDEFTWGRALNLGAAAATGEVLVLLSAHAVPVGTAWLEQLLAPLQAPPVAAVMGRQIPIPGLDPFEEIELELWFPPLEAPKQVSSISSASAAIRRNVWQEIRFDETLSLDEDGEWARAAMACGHQIMYAPHSVVWHSHPACVDTVYRRWFWRSYVIHSRAGEKPSSARHLARFVKRDVRYFLTHRCFSYLGWIPVYEFVRQGGFWAGRRAALSRARAGSDEPWGYCALTIPQAMLRLEPAFARIRRITPKDAVRMLERQIEEG
ncbi:MAG: glycosyltransferase family 2 protein [Anaerolineae bacterium]